MSRKYYVALAKAIKEAAQPATHCCADRTETMRVRLAHALADILAADNPRFDRSRFLNACGLGQTEVQS